jgi:hypothetical protein
MPPSLWDFPRPCPLNHVSRCQNSRRIAPATTKYKTAPTITPPTAPNSMRTSGSPSSIPTIRAPIKALRMQVTEKPRESQMSPLSLMFVSVWGICGNGICRSRGRENFLREESSRAPDGQAVFCRRRHQPRRPPIAKIRPGMPAPTMGPGMAAGALLPMPSLNSSRILSSRGRL